MAQTRANLSGVRIRREKYMDRSATQLHVVFGEFRMNMAREIMLIVS